MGNELSKKQSKKLKKLNANIRKGVYEDWATRFLLMLNDHAEKTRQNAGLGADSSIFEDGETVEQYVNTLLDDFVFMLDGDANDRFYEALNKINAKRNPGSYVLVKPLKRKTEV